MSEPKATGTAQFSQPQAIALEQAATPTATFTATDADAPARFPV